MKELMRVMSTCLANQNSRKNLHKQPNLSLWGSLCAYMVDSNSKSNTSQSASPTTDAVSCVLHDCNCFTFAQVPTLIVQIIATIALFTNPQERGTVSYVLMVLETCTSLASTISSKFIQLIGDSLSLIHGGQTIKKRSSYNVAQSAHVKPC